MSSANLQHPIIIRRKKIVRAHHGGSWKIALADFMTALMALFLVMWILTAASKEQRQAVAEYFRTPLVVALAGGDKSSASTSAIPGGGPDPMHADGERARVSALQQSRPSLRQQQFFQALQRRIEAALALDPSLRELRAQMRFDLVAEGLLIQVLDTEKRPMFSLGSDEVAPYMRGLLRTLAPILNDVPNELSISGHTDSVPYAGASQSYSNWELSSDRALASRRELLAGGLDGNKLLRVSGLADNVVRGNTAPISPSNRRIELMVLYEATAESIRRPRAFLDKPVMPDWLATTTAEETQAMSPLRGDYLEQEQ